MGAMGCLSLVLLLEASLDQPRRTALSFYPAQRGRLPAWFDEHTRPPKREAGLGAGVYTPGILMLKKPAKR
jgi:hypothetical protein